MNPPQGANSPEQNLVNSDDSNGASILRGVLCRVGTPSEPDPITGYPRILIYTDEESIRAVKILPLLKPVVVLPETEHAQLVSRVASLEGALEAKFSREEIISAAHVSNYIGLSSWEITKLLPLVNTLLYARRALLSPVPQEGQTK